MTGAECLAVARYHQALAAEIWPHALEHADRITRKAEAIAAGRVAEAADLVLAAHRARLRGESSPAACDHVADIITGRRPERRSPFNTIGVPWLSE